MCVREKPQPVELKAAARVPHSKHRQNTHNLQISSKYVEVFNHYYLKKRIFFFLALHFPIGFIFYFSVNIP